MKKYFIEFVCLFIINKELKSAVRKYLRSMDFFTDIFYFLVFNFYKIPDNTVLIYEPNNCHYETIPSYLKYFKENNFNVHVLTRLDMKHSKALCRLPKKYMPDKIFYVNVLMQKFLLNSSKILDYKKIFISTSINYFYGCSTLSTFKSDRILEKVLLMEHDNRQIENFDEHSLIRNHQLFMITNFENNPDIQTFVPDYYGNVKITPKNSEETIFISVGSLDPKRRNIKLLWESIEKLVLEGYSNFKVFIVGNMKNDGLSKTVLDRIEPLGKLDYEKMFEKMEEADFFLPLLDSRIEDNRNYLKYLSTGSINLIRGFRKPACFNEEFARVYGFNESNTLMYKENELFDAMKKAILLNKEEYAMMQENISQKSDVSIK